jgi:hypothetical protein
MSLSDNASKRLMIAVADKTAGQEVINAINAGVATSTQSALAVAGAIVAAHTSTTTDFASLVAGDVVLVIGATATTGKFGTVVTAGTLPFAAVIGSIYVVLRGIVLPSATALTF